ncbi:MAG TPA: 2OG-Fe(II) oxygenase [Candidatus Tectomicrobia bacterium]|nr:2OG-Fe(II) oxygenase [Candidatus Tectomicrobia bacterium]
MPRDPDEARAAAVDAEVRRAVAGLDVASLYRQYWEQNEFVHLDRWLPPSLVAAMVAEVERVRPAVNRAFIPRHKKGGSVGAWTLAGRAPTMLALYRAPSFLRLLAQLTRRAPQPCPDRDPHACALYFYTEPGDHIGFHFDTSYYRGARYTVLVGLIERSSSRLVCHLYKNDPRRAPREVRLATEPGTVVIFNGDRLWHAITPLGEGEERVSLSLEYVTDPSMHPLKRFVSNMKDAIAYFGFRGVFGRRPRAPLSG